MKPGDYPLRSPQSRAAARLLLAAKKAAERTEEAFRTRAEKRIRLIVDL